MMRWLDEQRDDLIVAHDHLIMDDAPKNKFSINTGKRLMIEEVKTKLEQLNLEDSKRTNL
jgi:hypothetical protein